MRRQSGCVRGIGYTCPRDVISGLHDQLDRKFNGVPIQIQALEEAIDDHIITTQQQHQQRGGQAGKRSLDAKMRGIAAIVNNIAQKLLTDAAADSASDSSSSSSSHPIHAAYEGRTMSKRLRRDRECFVAFQGPETLLRLLEAPFCSPDARDMTREVVNSRSEAINDVFILLRELCYCTPHLASRLARQDIITFLMTSLSHTTFFDHAIGLVEEILADQSQTFYLGLIPDLGGLLRSLSLRQLAHFCRILALLIFDPEDRALMESSRLVKSMEILQLRRERMIRTSSVIDRNQALVINLPQILPRLVKLLKIMNWGPPLHQLIQAVSGSFPPYEVLLLLGNMVIERNQWEGLDRLETLAASYVDAEGDSTPALLWPSLSSASSTNGNTEIGLGGLLPVTDLMSILAPFLTSATTPPADVNVRQIIQLVQTLQALGLENGQDGDNATNNNNMTNSNNNVAAPVVMQRLHRKTPARTAEEAVNELKFQALLLMPHQVEVLFIFCTLLGGRRKVFIQQRLAELGLVPVLTTMFDRLSWDEESAPEEASRPLQRPHGDQCECSAENALRVQYLRCLHNLLDFDREENFEHKKLVLSREERLRLKGWNPDDPTSLASWPDPSCPQGLLSKVIDVFKKQQRDSVYLFWLSSVVEALLRGSSPKVQLFIARTGGLFSHLVKEILSDGLKVAGNLQTAFDLLGELVKCNKRVLAMMDDALSGTDFRKLTDLLLSPHSVVDSNVFVRSLVLSLYDMADIGGPQDGLGGLVIKQRKSAFAAEDQEEEGLVSSKRRSAATFADDEEGEEEEEVDITKDEDDGVICGSKGKQREEDGRGNGRSYLLHSWLDPVLVPIPAATASSPREIIESNKMASCSSSTTTKVAWTEMASETGLSPVIRGRRRAAGGGRGPERSINFLSRNHIRLLKNLMSIVDLSEVNHENLCCLNTAVVICIFAHRRYVNSSPICFLFLHR